MSHYNNVQHYYLQIWMSYWAMGDVGSVLRDNWVIVVAISPDIKELQLAKIFILKRSCLHSLDINNANIEMLQRIRVGGWEQASSRPGEY